MERWCGVDQQLFEAGAPLALRKRAKIRAVGGEQIERDEFCGHFRGQLRDARGRGMQTQLQRVEVEPLARDDYNLAVDHTPIWEPREESVVELGEVAVERTQIAALNEHFGLASKHDRAKAVPLRLVEQAIADWKGVGQFREHRFDRRCERKRVAGDARELTIGFRLLDLGARFASHRRDCTRAIGLS
jgi:hypothetical protein